MRFRGAPVCLLVLSVGAGFAQDPGRKPKDDPVQIGNRDVGKGVNFYSLEKEIALGRQLAVEVRRQAKVVNFGVVYGMGYYGLSSRLGISMEDATAWIDAYFATYAGVRRYRDDCIEEAARKGYAITLLGRRRFIPELASPNRQTRELGERLAINTPLQGTAADIIKKAMVDVHEAMAGGGFEAMMTPPELTLEAATPIWPGSVPCGAMTSASWAAALAAILTCRLAPLKLRLPPSATSALVSTKAGSYVRKSLPMI